MLEINACLESGLRLSEIAKQFAVSQYALSRHRRHQNTAPQPTELSGNAAELAKWLNRADDQYLTASANGDVARAVIALTAGIRGLVASEKQRERERETQAAKNCVLPNGEHQLTVETMDSAIKAYLKSSGDKLCFTCGAPILQGRYLQPAMNDLTVRAETLGGSNGRN